MVDSSVWIDYFNGKECPEVTYLDAILGIKPVVIGDNILTEVLQGFRGDKEYKKAKQLLGKYIPYKIKHNKIIKYSKALFLLPNNHKRHKLVILPHRII